MNDENRTIPVNSASNSDAFLSGETSNNLTKKGQSRRRFLRLAGQTTLLGAGLAVLPFGALNLNQTQTTQIENPVATASVPADFVVESGFPQGGPYTSPVREVGQGYHAIGSYWEVSAGSGAAVEIAVRGSQDGVTFDDWQHSHADPTEAPRHAGKDRFFGRLLYIKAPFVQFKLDIPAGVTVSRAGLTFVDPGETSPATLARIQAVTTLATATPTATPAQTVTPAPTTPAPSVTPTPTPTPPPAPWTVPPLASPPVVSRADWGADETLRFNSLGEVWPPEYWYPKAIIVHHSDTGPTNNDDPSKDVRAIYRYHAISQGWGDIGYNFLIDWRGVIYEGRYGGANVVGGHALQYNYGSIGICLIGNFETTAPTAAQQDALVRLIAWHAAIQDITPIGDLFFVDRIIQPISGHRDVLQTACPGDSGYAILPDVRQKVSAILGQGVAQAWLQSLTVTPSTVTLGQTVKVEAVVTNVGKIPLETQEPKPNFAYNQDQTWISAALPKETGKVRLGLDFTGNQGVTYPYRWGMGQTLAPGATATITGFIKMESYGRKTLFGGLSQENTRYFSGNFAFTEINTIADGPNRTVRAASRASEPNTQYFDATGHNLRGVFLNYWNQYGGLSLFGLPLTEEFEEASDTQPGKTFLVQYFERNRFEYHPEYAGTKDEVLLGLLGVQLNSDQVFPLSTPFRNTASTIYVPQTKHSLGGAFYKYWQAHGGLPIFGYPISEEYPEKNPDDGKTYTVQYFERNRFEYHPEFKGTPYEVLLGLLGTELCRRKGWITG
ncbi:MAG: N-acetylmuramoyl-L-alanine amidase [Chloroflexi bacterium]|nr:N-acetylmuramoyl-L-alanine amidase [Chloroflexota bacterium]OJV98301.1 MAG: hypothetical protein BGO39_16095 [Chloroflexi bacterium 54-19]